MKLPDKFLVYLFSVCMLGLFASFRISWEQETKIPRDQESVIVFTVKKEPKISGSFRVISVGDGKVFLDLFPRYKVGDRLKVGGRVDPEGRMFNPSVEKLGEEAGFSSSFANLRQRIASNIYSYLPPKEATLVVGSVLGVDDIQADFRKDLISTGTIHVVVVSGQNLMIVAGVFVALAKFIGRKQSLTLATAAVFLYAFLTGFEPPVLRASLMVLATSVAIYFGREVSSLWSLLIAGLVIIFIWPSAIFEVSFQLTFAATLGIITMGQKLSKHLSRLPIFGANAAIATSAYLFTAPLIFIHFGQISLVAPLANLLVAEAVFPIMVFGIISSILSLIFAPLAQLFAYLAFVPALYFVKVVEIFASFYGT